MDQLYTLAKNSLGTAWRTRAGKHQFAGAEEICNNLL